MEKLEQHPLSSLWPLMAGSEFDDLTADIKTHGLRQHITGYEGMVLDGWNRYRACVAAGVAVKMRALPKGSDPRAFVWSANGARRNVTVSQRAAIAVAMAGWAPSGRPKNVTVEKGDAASPFSTVEDVAKAACVSGRTVQRAKKGEAAGLGAAMRAGLVTAEEAARLADVAENPEADDEPGEEPADYSKADHEEEMRAADAADFATMSAIIEADDRLVAAVGQVRKANDRTSSIAGLYEEKCRALAQMTSEAKRWMRAAEKSAACLACKTALGGA